MLQDECLQMISFVDGKYAEMYRVQAKRYQNETV